MEDFDVNIFLEDYELEARIPSTNSGPKRFATVSDEDVMKTIDSRIPKNYKK